MKNFGKINNIFNFTLAEGMVSKNDNTKLLFKNYIKAIKENVILRTQFLVYDNIENMVEENEFKATQFVQENIALMSKFSKKDILEANANLVKPVLSEQAISYEKETLHENIAKLIFAKKSAKNINEMIDCTSKIVEYIKSNKEKEIIETIDLPMSMLSTIMVDKYNEKYSELSESERKMLKVLIESTEEEKKNIYSITIRECIDLIDSKFKTADLDSKDRLLRVKDKLLNDKIEIDENFTNNLSKLVELKETLLEG